MRRFIKTIKKYLFNHVGNNNFGKDHNCLENKELIERYPLYGNLNGSFLEKGLWEGVKYKCKVCRMEWHK